MRCIYCRTFCESESRVSYGSEKNRVTEHFCLWVRKMVSGGNPICEEFTIADNFFCKRNSCQLSIPMCTARQINTSGIYPECTHCSQKREILEIKRFAGFKKRNGVGHIAEVPFIPPPEQIPIPTKTIRRRITV